MATPEGKIKAQILKDHGARKGLIIWNHPTGVGFPAGPLQQARITRDMVGMTFADALYKLGIRPITYGQPGSGDIIGAREITISPDMVGNTIGQAVAIEVKTPTGRQPQQQKIFQKVWQALGGLFILARSSDDVRQGLE